MVDGGAITVPAHVIYDIVRKLPDGAQVSLETSGETGQMLIRSGRSRFTLGALPEADFPDLAAGELPHSFELPAADLKRLIDKTQFAISTEETRYYLNGIFFHTIEAEARSSCAPSPPTATASPASRWRRRRQRRHAGIIVPRKAVAEIQKLVEDGGETVGVEISSAKVRFSFSSGVTLISKLIDGTFPDYARVIPTGNDKRLTVERDQFAKAVDRVSTISSERGRAVKLAMTDGRLSLSVNNPDSGSATEELDVDYDPAPRYRLQRPLPPRHHRPARRRHRPVPPRRSGLADGDPGPRGRAGALRADADAGVRAGAPRDRPTKEPTPSTTLRIIPGLAEGENRVHNR